MTLFIFGFWLCLGNVIGRLSFMNGQIIVRTEYRAFFFMKITFATGASFYVSFLLLMFYKVFAQRLASCIGQIVANECLKYLAIIDQKLNDLCSHFTVVANVDINDRFVLRFS